MPEDGVGAGDPEVEDGAAGKRHIRLVPALELQRRLGQHLGDFHARCRDQGPLGGTQIRRRGRRRGASEETVLDRRGHRDRKPEGEQDPETPDDLGLQRRDASDDGKLGIRLDLKADHQLHHHRNEGEGQRQDQAEEENLQRQLNPVQHRLEALGGQQIAGHAEQDHRGQQAEEDPDMHAKTVQPGPLSARRFAPSGLPPIRAPVTLAQAEGAKLWQSQGIHNHPPNTRRSCRDPACLGSRGHSPSVSF